MSEERPHGTTQQPGGLGIDWVRTSGGALAAVASAVLLSTLGAAGTLIGAALGSIVITVGSAVFTRGLATSKDTLAKAQAGALQKVGIAQAEVRRAGRMDDTRAQESHLEHAREQLAEAHEELDRAAAQPAAPGWRGRLAALGWKRVALTAAGLFVVAVVVITAFELVAGRSVADLTGGSGAGGRTTIGDLGGGSGGSGGSGDGSGNDQNGGDQDTTTPTSSPSGSSGASGSTEPSGQPSSSSTPSETTEPTPSEATTPTGTTTLTPSAPPS